MTQPTTQITPVNPNQQPKARFQASPDNIKKHRDLVDSREFERGADFALLQYVQSIKGTIVDGTSAMAAGFKIYGAVELLEQMKTLAEKATIQAPVPTGNLDHSRS